MQRQRERITAPTVVGSKSSGRSGAGKKSGASIRFTRFFCNNFAVCSFCAKTGLDAEKGVTLHPGGFAEAPAKMNHYAWTASEAIVQVHGQGPFVITYVNPADDPSTK